MNTNESINTARDRMTAMATTAKDKAANLQNQATEWVSEHADQLSDTQKKLVASTTSYVQANPLKSLGFAALAALVIGRLMR